MKKKTTTKKNTSCVCVHMSASGFRQSGFSLSLKCDHLDRLSTILTKENDHNKRVGL